MHRLVDPGEQLVHVARLRAGCCARLAVDPPAGAQPRVALTAADWSRCRLELTAAQDREGRTVEVG